MGPVLYSFRRCPYAMRARLALAAAGQAVELREVALKAKPPELLEASSKGTVPVLVQADGAVLEESLEIMRWALEQADPLGWLQADGADTAALIAQNDGPFKRHLDRFKYPDRYGEVHPMEHRAAALVILREWEQRLAVGGWLLGAQATLADWSLLPFVRQFRLADPDGFASEPGLEGLKDWLARFERSELLTRVMDSPGRSAAAGVHRVGCITWLWPPIGSRRVSSGSTGSPPAARAWSRWASSTPAMRINWRGPANASTPMSAICACW